MMEKLHGCLEVWTGGVQFVIFLKPQGVHEKLT